MADGYLMMVNKVTASLNNEECRTLLYLCTDLFSNRYVEDLRGALLNFPSQTLNQGGQSHSGKALLLELMFRMKRFDLLKAFSINKQQVEGILQKESAVSEYRVLMTDLNESLNKEELQHFSFLLSGTLPKERLTRSTSFLDVVVELEKIDEVSCNKLDFLERCMKQIHRIDLVKRIQAFKNRGQNRSCASPIPFKHQSPVKSKRQLHSVSKEFKNLKLSVPETAAQPAFTDIYQMFPEQRGLCVIIDCVGSDGDMLNSTFQRLGFRVVLHSLLGLRESKKVLEDLTRLRSLQQVGCLVCCIISRGTDSHLLATDSCGLGISLNDLRQIFTTNQSCALYGKPKLFFTQIYRSTDAPLLTPTGFDEDLETDAPSCTMSRRQHSDSRSIPQSADVLWSLCTANAKQLEASGHKSIYLQALNSALLKGRERKMAILDLMTEVNRNVFDYNQQNPNKYQIQLSHTLRKVLYI
ncbi:hypothetical protein DNTS_025834 [Danionella cerebrum]|uniref:CASP8 and FADD-like apoptosis regulator n=1 Tax=Danionella cerebrum TaxID=2873325 RepID=A0A553NA53_9TELE|nr:hypothetical protein DNTS_025834 [Danionella translucida]